jgi:tRNA(Ile)-lysidine synthase
MMLIWRGSRPFMGIDFETRLAATWPPEEWTDVGVLVAVSGGADSVALVRALPRIAASRSGQLSVAHFNHGLRGPESAADERFVVQLCDALTVPCEVGHPAAPLPSAVPDGLEAAARDARYRFLLGVAERRGARYLVTAHTADDQVETILHRIVRGTGIAGLSGMPRARSLSPAVTLLRPMLAIRRSEVLEYLTQLGQPYRDDSSNTDSRFTRNRLRHDLLPRLASDYNAEIGAALLRLGSLAGEVQQVVDRLVDELAQRAVVEQTAQDLRLDAAALAAQPAYLVRETLIALWRRQAWPMQAMDRGQWELLADMAATALTVPHGTTCKHVFPGEIHATAAAGQLRLVATPR